jgi:drug/metabolite transporter (DMT)-like permease
LTTAPPGPTPRISSALTLLLNAIAALLWWGERLDRPTALGLALALAATLLLYWG